jgi:rubredoxin
MLNMASGTACRVWDCRGCGFVVESGEGDPMG